MIGYLPWNSDFRGLERHLSPKPRWHINLAQTANDPALLIGLLSNVATQISLFRTGTINEVALQLQGQAIKLQAKACADNNSTDGRIATGLAIMSNHLAAGNPSEMIPHMKAMQSFVSQRGGIYYLGMDGLLADNICYGDHTKVVIYNTRPPFTLPMPSLQPEERRGILRHLGQAFSNLRQDSGISEQVYRVARDLCLLTDIYNRAI